MKASNEIYGWGVCDSNGLVYLDSIGGTKTESIKRFTASISKGVESWRKFRDNGFTCERVVIKRVIMK